MWTLFIPILNAAEPAPAPLPMVPDARFALALYCNPRCDDAALDALDTALGAIPTADEFSEQAPVPTRVMGVAGAEFGIPDAEALRELGPAVDDPAALSRSEMVVLAWFAGPRERSVETFALAHAAFAAAAKAQGGWVEDLDTQSVYDAADWAARDPRGPIQDWFVVDQAPMAEGSPTLRLVTRGLRRYGDFELVVEDVKPERLDDVAWAIDAIADTLHPLGEVPPELAVQTDAVQGTARLGVAADLRADDPAAPVLRARFSGKVSVQLGPLVAAEMPVPTPPPPAGPPAPPAAPAPPPASVEGAGEAPLALPVDRPAAAPRRQPATLDEARAAVREALVSLESAWGAGLPKGDAVAVSAPFTTRTGTKEYLWVEVSRWQEGGMSGKLLTEPYEVLGLHKGDTVNLKQAEVYDYVYRRADGTKEGNLTRPFR